jgi:hypothetical protein
MIGPRWRLAGIAHDLVLAPWNVDAREHLLGESETLRALDRARTEGPSWTLNNRVITRCAAYLRRHHGFSNTFRATDDLALVREGITRGVIIAWRQDALHVASRVPSDLDSDALFSATTSAQRERTWIEIELLDMEGAPVPFERYWIKLPDGTVREGALDAKGRAYFGDLDPGTADIRWPDRDGDATLEARGLGQQPVSQTTSNTEEPLGERTWIEIELLDMEGAPVPNEAYWIKLPDGTIRTGRLDDSGRAYFNDLDVGNCLIRWPDRDDEATLLDLDATTAHPDNDVAAQVETLLAAAEEGVPFCEECERARAAANG